MAKPPCSFHAKVRGGFPREDCDDCRAICGLGPYQPTAAELDERRSEGFDDSNDDDAIDRFYGRDSNGVAEPLRDPYDSHLTTKDER